MESNQILNKKLTSQPFNDQIDLRQTTSTILRDKHVQDSISAFKQSIDPVSEIENHGISQNNFANQDSPKSTNIMATDKNSTKYNAKDGKHSDASPSEFNPKADGRSTIGGNSVLQQDYVMNQKIGAIGIESMQRKEPPLLPESVLGTSIEE